MLNRCLLALLAIASAGCTTPSTYERLAIPVVEKSTHLNAESMMAVLPKMASPEPEEIVPAAVFVPAKAIPIEQKVSFVSDSDEWANQQKSKVAVRKPVKKLITDQDLDDKIDELHAKYEKGDAEAAYQMVALLLKRKRVEEAETALDYAARQRHVPSMMLYARYFQKIGDKGMAKKWFEAASEAGSREASAELKTI